MEKSTEGQSQQLLSSTSPPPSPAPSPAPHLATQPRSVSSFTRSPLSQSSATPDSPDADLEGRISSSTRSGSNSGSTSSSVGSRAAGVGAGGAGIGAGVGAGGQTSRPPSRGSSMLLLGTPRTTTVPTPGAYNDQAQAHSLSRGSMILYRFADESEFVSQPSSPTPLSRRSTFSNLLAAAAPQANIPSPPSPPSPSPLAGADHVLLPPTPHFRRESTLSASSSNRSSIVSLSADESKYPSIYAPHGSGYLGNGVGRPLSTSVAGSGDIDNEKWTGGGRPRTLIPYVYDPLEDGDGDADGEVDDMDLLHDPTIDEKAGKKVFSRGGLAGGGRFPWRGIANVGLLVVIILALITLFVGYPVIRFYHGQRFNEAIDGNIQINSTGQAPLPVFPFSPTLIDLATPTSAHTRTGFDGESYDLVFSDEFEVSGRTFYPGDDAYWEAADLWYGSTADLEWYDPSQVTTRDGHLVITMDSAATVQSGLTQGSTAPFSAESNHNLTYRSGMLKSWNKFCFSSGYIEVAIVLPGPDANTQGYWPGAWTMGNLGRPGYGATTEGMWPYTYDSCDVGTFPNQTLKDGSGPAAALHSDQSRSKYNFDLSWLPGQRLSACTCPATSSYTPDHPGPFRSNSGTWLGRGAPEIDILEAEKDKVTNVGQVVSQSAQFAPFSHDYVFLNDTEDEFKIWDTSKTRINSYHGSAVQQAVSALSSVPDDGFQGSGKQFVTYGFEYWADPNSRSDGFITWQVDGSPTARMGAASVGPDQGSDGSGVGQRLIPEEPMSIVLNLGISSNWQTIDLSTMVFPAEMLVDYVRVYQRKGQTNIGCDPKGYPTADYIQSHMEAYGNPNATAWMYDKPKNSQYDGC